MERMLVRSFLVACLLASNCVAQPYFFRKDILVGQHPTDVIPGDFNGDGRPDLAVSTEEGIFVLLNAGNGSFERPVLTKTPTGTYWMPMAADFNGDGTDDLVGSGSLYLSRGDGTFFAPRPIGEQEAVAAADFNGDGKMDLLMADSNWNDGSFTTLGVRVLLGNGDGTFRSGAQITPFAAAQVRVADFNHDGRPDVAMLPVLGVYPDLTPPGSTTLLVFLGKGDGTFGPEIQTKVQSSITSFLIADFNGDKLPDVFTAEGARLGVGDGTFRSPVPYGTEDLGSPLAAADFTGDGYADLVVVYWGAVAICPGKGDGTMLPPVGVGPLGEPGASYPFGTSYVPLPVDLDGDGRLDLVTLNYAANSVMVLMGRAQGGPALRRAVSAAIDLAIVAPGSLATLFAPTSATTRAATPPWPDSLGGIRLEVRDSAGASHRCFTFRPRRLTFRCLLAQRSAKRLSRSRPVAEAARLGACRWTRWPRRYSCCTIPGRRRLCLPLRVCS